MTAQAPSGSRPKRMSQAGGIDAFARDIVGDVEGDRARLRADLQLDGDACVEKNAVENFCDSLGGRRQSEAMRAIGAREHQRQAA